MNVSHSWCHGRWTPKTLQTRLTNLPLVLLPFQNFLDSSSRIHRFFLPDHTPVQWPSLSSLKYTNSEDIHLKSTRIWSLSSAQAFFWFLFPAGAFEFIEASKSPLLRVVGRVNFMECWWKSSVVAANIESFLKQFLIVAQSVTWRAFARVLSFDSVRGFWCCKCGVNWGKCNSAGCVSRNLISLRFCLGLGWCANHLTVTLMDRHLSQRMKVWV